MDDRRGRSELLVVGRPCIRLHEYGSAVYELWTRPDTLRDAGQTAQTGALLRPVRLLPVSLHASSLPLRLIFVVVVVCANGGGKEKSAELEKKIPPSIHETRAPKRDRPRE